MKQKPWITIFRKFKRGCNKPKSNKYRCRYYYLLGALGYEWDFTHSLEIKYLWERDKAGLMKDPVLAIKGNKKRFCKDNCYFKERDEG